MYKPIEQKINKKVMVSGCFDLFHAGHAKFLNEAAKYGEVYASVGSDENVEKLKNVRPTFTQEERCFILESLRSVKKAFVPEGEGLMDFEEELRKISPDYFIVNEDGHKEEKRRLCEEVNAEYIILKRIPESSLPARSSTELRKRNNKKEDQEHQE